MKKQFIFWIFLSVILSANEENFLNISINEKTSAYLDEQLNSPQIFKMKTIYKHLFCVILLKLK